RSDPVGKHVIERSIEEARKHGHQFVGTEHLLIALAEMEEGAAASFLRPAGVNADSVWNAMDLSLSVDPAGDPYFVIVWDPELVDEGEYAELVTTLGSLVRSERGAGIQRVLAKSVGVPCEAGVKL